MTDFYRVDNRLPLSTQIKYINEMILKLAGKVDQGKFDVNEIEALYSDLGSSYTRKFLRSQGIGNTILSYTDWTWYKNETGYSIWKILPTTYSYHDANEIYIDNKVLENKGEATALTTQFDYVYTFDDESGGSYTNVSSDISSENSSEVSVLADTGDYLYIGDSSTFEGIKIEFNKRGSNYDIDIEYYDETSGEGWTLLDSSNNLVDGTSDFISDGAITFSAPDTWGQTTVNGQTKYWVRISTSTTPITQAEIYYCTSGDSVEGLLALSSIEAIEQTWKFCTYGGYIYVTLPNSGATDYEGTDYITSSSSASNLQNFFIYNKPITGNYLNSNY